MVVVFVMNFVLVETKADDGVGSAVIAIVDLVLLGMSLLFVAGIELELELEFEFELEFTRCAEYCGCTTAIKFFNPKPLALLPAECK